MMRRVQSEHLAQEQIQNACKLLRTAIFLMHVHTHARQLESANRKLSG